MSAKVFFIHGWSVRTTQTYQALHLKLAEQGFELKNIYLGRYVSLENEVEIRDISKAMHRALSEELGGDWSQPFHMITHSTGALVVKHWILNYYRGTLAQHQPLKNVVFLAAPHFGSRLAHHGRTMLAEIMELGETGKKILGALELGSTFSWEVNEGFFDPENWEDKGIRLYNLIGDRVKQDRFKSKIFPAAYEPGSDMVVRVASGNLNFRRYVFDSRDLSFVKLNEIKGIPFGALYRYTHSNEDFGIMNSIKRRTTLNDHQALQYIVKCLKVDNDAAYTAVYNELIEATRETRTKRQGFAQLDFRFRDDDGKPVTDYLVEIGAIVNGVEKPSKTVAQLHKNKLNPNHLTIFINLKELEPELKYFINIKAVSESDLYAYQPNPLTIEMVSNTITELITEDHTTQIDVILARVPSENLFVFHKGNDPDLHVTWDRSGKVKKTKGKIA